MPTPPHSSRRAARRTLVVVPLLGALVAAVIGVVLLLAGDAGVSGWPFLLSAGLLAGYALTLGRRQAR